MNDRAIGLIELTSIAAGFQVADTMLKASNVQLLLSRSICSGKYMVLIGGDVAAVGAAVHAGCSVAKGCLIDQFVIPKVHADVFAALARSRPVEPTGALGILESFNVANLILAADTAVKAANVEIIEVRLGRGLGGKSFVIITGEVAAVRAAIDAGIHAENTEGLVVSNVVIPSPHPDMVRALM